MHVTGDDPPLAGWNAIWGASFNPDRTRIAFSGCISGNFDCGIFVVPINDAGAATGPPVAAAYQGLAGYPSYLYPAWSPDGKFLAYRGWCPMSSELRVVTLRVGGGGEPLAAERVVWRAAFPSAGCRPGLRISKSLAFSVSADPMFPAEGAGSGGSANQEARSRCPAARSWV